MPKYASVLLVVALMLPCFALAQFDDDDMDSAAPAREWRVRAGWFDMGDADSGLGIGVDYLFPAFKQNWSVGLEWGDGETSATVLGHTVTESLDVWGLTWNWLKTVQTPEYKNNWYYGAGLGWYRVENGDSDDSFGLQLVAGMDLSKSWYGEIKYVFGTDFEGDADVDGLRVSFGYKFGKK